MKLLLENWKKYLKETSQMSMFPGNRWAQLEDIVPGDEKSFYDTWAALRFGEEERREITAKVDNMPQEEFDEMLAQISRTIQYQSREYYNGKIPESQASAIRFYQVRTWKKE
jgi:hypothetical protein